MGARHLDCDGGLGPRKGGWLHEAGAPASSVEMSALIIAALCAMMRGEIKTGMFEMEHRSTNQLNRTIGRSASAT